MMLRLFALLFISLAIGMEFFGHCYHIDPHMYQYNPYNYGYDVEDYYGNKQWKQEKSIGPHEVHGSYGFRDTNGVYREVVYVADKDGFRANVKTNEPGVANSNPSAVKVEAYHPNSVYPKHNIISQAPIYGSSPNY